MNSIPRQKSQHAASIIALGIAMWALRHFEALNEPSTYLFIVSAGLFVIYLYRREEGLLIPAAIVGGLALNWILSESWSPVGIGCSLLAITVVALFYQRKFIGWPLIPGTILVLFGLPGFRPFEFLRDNWLLLVIGIGVLIVLVAVFRRDFRKGEPEAHADR